MQAIVFFLAGIPLVFVVNKLVVILTSFESDLVERREDEKALPWQQGPWPPRVRWAVLALLPFALAIAGARFDFAQAVAVSALAAALLICTATDLLRFRVPNVVTYPAIVAALLASILLPGGDIASAALAALAAGGVFLLLAFINPSGLGLGDVKLAALIGAGLGLQVGMMALFWGILAAALVMGAMWAVRIVKRKQGVPYAPFLSLAAIVVMLLQGAAFAPL